MEEQRQAAYLRRLASAAEPRAFVGVPMEVHTVQIRGAAHGWPDWIDVAEAFGRRRADAMAHNVREALVDAELGGVEVQVITRRVLS